MEKYVLMFLTVIVAIFLCVFTYNNGFQNGRMTAMKAKDAFYLPQIESIYACAPQCKPSPTPIEEE